MSKHAVKGFVTYEKSSYAKEPTVGFLTFRPDAKYWPDMVVVSEHSIEVEVPDDFNPIPDLVAQLQEQKRLMRLALAKELAAIDERIGKLTCITNEAITTS